MRGQITFNIEGYEKPITVTELTMRQIISLFQFESLDKIESWSSITDYVKNRVIPLTANLSLDELLDFAPSEIEQIWTRVKEVNKTFFGLTRTPMIQKVFEEAKAKLSVACGDSFAGLSNLATLTQENMDTLISLMRSTKTKKSKPKK